MKASQEQQLRQETSDINNLYDYKHPSYRDIGWRKLSLAVVAGSSSRGSWP